jgi:hypothetical protein
MVAGDERAPEAIGLRRLWVALLAAAALRLVVTFAAGIVEWSQGASFPTGRTRAADVLITFGGAGDLAGALLVLVLAGLLVWAARLGAVRGRLPWSASRWVAGLTAFSAVCGGVGYGIGFSDGAAGPLVWSRLVLSTGFAGAALLVLLAGLGAMSGVQSPPVAGEGVAVFAVDRMTGEVFAYPSLGDASRRAPLASVEEGELEFFTDEGLVLEATVVDGQLGLRPTEQARVGVLLDRLAAFAAAHGIAVEAAGADDPLAYAAPIAEWQWLQLWPGWMRGVGRVIRRR